MHQASHCTESDNRTNPSNSGNLRVQGYTTNWKISSVYTSFINFPCVSFNENWPNIYRSGGYLKAKQTGKQK